MALVVRSSAVAITLLAVACTPATARRPASRTTPPPVGASAEVSRAVLTEWWPFTVPTGVVHCAQSSSGDVILTFTSNARTYALNGYARRFGYLDVSAIHAEEANPAGKRDLRPIQAHALAICG